MDDIPLAMTRKGYPEETHFSFSYTPIQDEDGAVLGFFCPCDEITERVIEARRARLQAELTERLRALRRARCDRGGGGRAARAALGRRGGRLRRGRRRRGHRVRRRRAQRWADAPPDRVAAPVRVRPGLSGTRCARARRLFVEDVEADPRWAAERAEALRARAAAAGAPSQGRAARGDPLRLAPRAARLARGGADAPARGRRAHLGCGRMGTGRGRRGPRASGVCARSWRASPNLSGAGLDGHGEWTWASPRWAAYTGLSEEESLGRRLARRRCTPRDPQRRRWRAWAAAEAGERFEVEYRVRHAATRRQHRWCQTPRHARAPRAARAANGAGPGPGVGGRHHRRA